MRMKSAALKPMQLRKMMGHEASAATHDRTTADVSGGQKAIYNWTVAERGSTWGDLTAKDGRQHMTG
eukprot:2324100-Prymnesium_polylepis.3